MRQYRLRHLTSQAVSTVDEDGYQALKGRGWLGRYAVEEVTVAELKNTSFMPPRLIELKNKAADPVATPPPVEVVEKRKPGRPKKIENA
jgi:hypothetical protein